MGEASGSQKDGEPGYLDLSEKREEPLPKENMTETQVAKICRDRCCSKPSDDVISLPSTSSSAQIQNISGPAFINSNLQLSLHNCSENFKVVLYEQINNCVTKVCPGKAGEEIEKISRFAVDEIFSLLEFTEYLKSNKETRRAMIVECLEKAEGVKEDLGGLFKDFDWDGMEEGINLAMRELRRCLDLFANSEDLIIENTKYALDKGVHKDAAAMMHSVLTSTERIFKETASNVHTFLEKFDLL